MQPYFDPTRNETSNKMEDDLKKKMEDNLKKMKMENNLNCPFTRGKRGLVDPTLVVLVFFGLFLSIFCC
jgi:hypothetical protein